eukprot:scaffold63404_cov35-Tisochrysis_lutea.AAC.4
MAVRATMAGAYVLAVVQTNGRCGAALASRGGGRVANLSKVCHIVPHDCMPIPSCLPRICGSSNVTGDGRTSLAN